MKSKSNYLKYWRPVKFYIKAKYEITEAELEMILFLYSEGYFNKDVFLQYDRIMSWSRNRLCKLIKNGWIDIFRERKGSQKALYQVSHKSSKMITTLYNILDGKDLEFKGVDQTVFKSQVSFTDKFYQRMLEKMKQDAETQREHLRQTVKAHDIETQAKASQQDTEMKIHGQAHDKALDYKKAIDVEHLKGQFALILAHLGHEHAKQEANIMAREAD